MTGIASISCARWMVFEVMLSFLGLSKAELLALGVTVIQYGKIRNQWKGTTARQRQGLKRQPLRLKGENLERIRHAMAGLKSSHLASLDGFEHALDGKPSAYQYHWHLQHVAQHVCNHGHSHIIFSIL